MPTKAGQIVINLSAGTSQFVQDLEKAKGKIHEFGSAGVSEHKAIAASAKALEGNLFNNTRAMDGFLEKLKLGGLANAAFPVLGALAFAGVIVETGKKVVEFFKNLSEAPEKSRAAWNTLNATLRQSNAELDLTNARLEQDINKLEGKRQNGLAIALEEARVAAMNLGTQLEKDIDSMLKLLKEQEPGMFEKFMGGISNKPVREALGGTSSVGGAYGQLQDIDVAEDKALNDAKAKKLGHDAIDNIVAGFNSQRSAVGEAVRKVIQDQISDIKKSRITEDQTVHLPERYTASGQYVPAHDQLVKGDPEAKKALEELHNAQIGIDQWIDHVSKATTSEKLTGTKAGLEANANNEKNTSDVFGDRVKKLNAEIVQLQSRYAAVGQSQSFQNMAKAAGDATVQIEEINKALEAAHKGNKALPASLTSGQEQEIRDLALKKQTITAEGDWQTELQKTNVSIADRIRLQVQLTNAIGKGYEATKAATVEGQLASKLGDHYTDPEFMADPKNGVSGLRSGLNSDYDATHADQTGRAVQALTQQIQLERELSVAEMSGAEAVRATEHAFKLREIAMNNSADEAQTLIEKENELYAAQSETHTSEIISKIKEQTEAESKLGAAIWQGAEATRQAQLENKYSQIRRTATGTPEEIDAQINAARLEDQQEHLNQINEEAAKLTNHYADQLAHLNEMKTALEGQISAGKNITDNAIALRDVEDEILKLMVDQTLKLGTLQSGFKSFFLEMEEQAKKPGQILYDGLNKAMDDVSDQMAKLLTGQKTSWAKTFQGLGESLTKDATKSAMQQGLGQLGKILFPNAKHNPLDTSKPDGTESHPWFVKIAGSGGKGNGDNSASGVDPSLIGGSDDSSDDGSDDSSSGATGIGGILGKILKKFLPGGGGNSDDSDSDSGDMPMFANGGEVMPNQSVVVGDGGDGSGAEVFTPKTAGTVTPMDHVGGGAGGVVYNIDARHADLGAANRIHAAIKASHDSGVKTSVRTAEDRKQRRPVRKP